MKKFKFEYPVNYVLGFVELVLISSVQHRKNDAYILLHLYYFVAHFISRSY